MEIKPGSFYTIRFNDCDPLGHLNNARYLDYFLNAREDHLRSAYGIDLKAWVAQGHTFVVTRHEIQYIRPVSYNDQVFIQSALLELTDTSLLVEMLMLDPSAASLKSICWTTFTRVDFKTGKRAQHPTGFLEMFGSVLATDIDHSQGLTARIAAFRASPPAP